MSSDSSSNATELLENLCKSGISLGELYPTIRSEYAKIIASERTPDEKINLIRQKILKFKAENPLSSITSNLPEISSEKLSENEYLDLTELKTKYIQQSIKVVENITCLCNTIASMVLSNVSPEEKIKKLEDLMLIA